MGGTQSSSINQYVRNNVSTTNTQNAILSLEANSETNVKIRQDITVTIRAGRNLNINGLTVTNTGVTDLRIISSLEEDISLEFVQKLQAAMETDLDSTVKQSTGFMSGLFPAQQANQINNTIHTELSSVLKTTMDVTSVRNFFVNINQIQNGVFLWEADKDVNVNDVVIDQNLQIVLVSEQMIGTVIDSMFRQEAIIEILNKVAAKSSQHQAGIDDVFREIGELLAKLFSGLVVPLIVFSVIVAMIIAAVIVLKKKKDVPPPGAPNASGASGASGASDAGAGGSGGPAGEAPQAG